MCVRFRIRMRVSMCARMYVCVYVCRYVGVVIWLRLCWCVAIWMCKLVRCRGMEIFIEDIEV